MAAIHDFLRTKLKPGEDFISELGDLEITRLKDKPSKPDSKNKIVSEALVTFPNKEVRDIVRGSARNLAGDPRAGIRLEIPAHLQKNFQALETVSYGLRKKYPGLRRNLKFNDAEMDVVLDSRLPLCENWRRIRPDQALLSIPKSAGARREVGSTLIKEMIAGSFDSPDSGDDDNADEEV